MSDICIKVLAVLRGLVSDWYTVEIVSEFSELSIDETSDALCDLEVMGEIEISEWEDAIRVHLKEKEDPLTEDQKLLVQQWVPLAYKMAMEKCDRKWLQNEELAQHLCFELIDIVKRYDPEICPNFLTYACPCLEGARTNWQQSQYHLRGYKQGKTYENMPQIKDMNLDDPAVRDEFEAAFCYDDRREYEIRDEVLEMLSELSYEQAQAIILTEYYEMTLAEAAETLHSTRDRINKMKKKGLDCLKNNTKKKKEVEEYSSDFRRLSYLMPKVLLGSSKPWPAHGSILQKKKKKKKKEVKPCPVCSEKPLDEISYCLYCDRWGLDGVTNTTLNRKPFAKAGTLSMTKVRDKYRHRTLEMV